MRVNIESCTDIELLRKESFRLQTVAESQGDTIHGLKEQTTALQEEIERLREALEEIGYMGISQSPAMNMPQEDWLGRLFSKCQWIAKQALGGEDGK